MNNVRPHINHNILLWARERVNYSPEKLAKRAGVSIERYLEWEQGETRPTFRQLNIVAKALGRSTSFFYLKEPPQESEPRLEMRRVYGSNPKEDSRNFALEVQDMLQRRNVTIELYERLNETVSKIPLEFQLTDSPEEAAQKTRKWLGVSFEEQLRWDGKYVALKAWRKALEANGILPFQISGIPIEEVRGFAINYRPIPIVAFNSNDSVTARIFTLMHELGHILLGESVLHERSPFESESEIEQWCNRFSAAVLMPEKLVVKLTDHSALLNTHVWQKEQVESLSRKLWVSPSAMVRRLSTMRLISEENFESLKQIFDRYRSAEKSSGGSHYNNVLAKLGTLLPALAFQGFYSGELNARDLSKIMGTSVQKMGKMEEKVMGANYAF
ncbi:MAG: ImmA/IrrE family metallo-endopeptidase [Candidatus Paceibacterota bacterium]